MYQEIILRTRVSDHTNCKTRYERDRIRNWVRIELANVALYANMFANLMYQLRCVGVAFHAASKHYGNLSIALVVQQSRFS